MTPHPHFLGVGEGIISKSSMGNPILNFVSLRQIEERTARRATVGVWRTTAYYSIKGRAVRSEVTFLSELELKASLTI